MKYVDDILVIPDHRSEPWRSMSLEACLPANLRRPDTTITRVAAGLSGAGVYRIDADGKAFVLKISSAAESLADWQTKAHIQQLAANASLTPPVVHVDEARRAVVSAFVVDRSFLAFYWDPRTRAAALTQLGQLLRRLHELPAPPGMKAKDPQEFLGQIWSGVRENFVLPAFVRETVERVLTEPRPVRDRGLVLSHNDVNPSNLIYDGEQLRLLDWEVAGPNDFLYDLATVSVFLRMDEETCQRLLAAYEDQPAAALPAPFAWHRRLMATLCGVNFVGLARQSGHPGALGTETIATSPSLGEFYQRLQSGALSLATKEGQWSFGLALIKTAALTW